MLQNRRHFSNKILVLLNILLLATSLSGSAQYISEIKGEMKGVIISSYLREKISEGKWSFYLSQSETEEGRVLLYFTHLKDTIRCAYDVEENILFSEFDSNHIVFFYDHKTPKTSLDLEEFLKQTVTKKSVRKMVNRKIGNIKKTYDMPAGSVLISSYVQGHNEPNEELWMLDQVIEKMELVITAYRVYDVRVYSDETYDILYMGIDGKYYLATFKYGKIKKPSESSTIVLYAETLYTEMKFINEQMILCLQSSSYTKNPGIQLLILLQK